MGSETLGTIFKLIQQDITEHVSRHCRDADDAKRYAETLRRCAELAKHDIPAFIDAQTEMACKLLEGDTRLQGHFKYTVDSIKERVSFIERLKRLFQ